MSQIPVSGFCSHDSGFQAIMSQVPETQFQGPRCQGTVSQGTVSQNPRVSVLGLRVGSLGPRVPGLRVTGLRS